MQFDQQRSGFVHRWVALGGTICVIGGMHATCTEKRDVTHAAEPNGLPNSGMDVSARFARTNDAADVELDKAPVDATRIGSWHEEDTLLIIDVVRFPRGSAKIPPEGERLLDVMAPVLKKYPGLIYVRGRGNPAERRPDLPPKRARIVIEGLVRRGLDRNSLVSADGGATEGFEATVDFRFEHEPTPEQSRQMREALPPDWKSSVFRD